MTPREQAALAVARAEAALLDARKALREAVKAEIAAMPPLPEVAYPMVPCSACGDPGDPVVGLCAECDTDPNDAGRVMRDAERIQSARASMVTVLGDPACEQDPEFPEAGFCLWNFHNSRITLYKSEGADPITVGVESSDGYMGRQEYFDVTTTLDAALRHALTWLAERDVFVAVPR